MQSRPLGKIHVDSIARKYIVPDEGTLDLALMFVPSESVYYEMLMTSDSKGEPLDSYCRGKCIVAVSPNTRGSNRNGRFRCPQGSHTKCLGSVLTLSDFLWP